MSAKNLEENQIQFLWKGSEVDTVEMTTSSMKLAGELLDDFKRFLLSIGFVEYTVNTITTTDEIDDRLCLIKQDLKNAWDLLEQKEYDAALKKIQEAYDE